MVENGPNSVARIWITFLSIGIHVYSFLNITKILVFNSRPYFCIQNATIFQHSDAGTAALSRKTARVLCVVAQISVQGLRVAILICCSVYIRIALRCVVHWSVEKTEHFMRGVLLHLARYGLRLDGVMILASRICLFRHGSVILRMSQVIRQTRFAVMSLCCAHRTGVHGDARGGHLLLLFEICCVIICDALYFAMAYTIASFK